MEIIGYLGIVCPYLAYNWMAGISGTSVQLELF